MYKKKIYCSTGIDMQDSTSNPSSSALPSSTTYPVDIEMSFTKIIIDWFNSSYLYLL